MTKRELWNKYVERNPSFDGDGNVTLSARGLRKMFDQTWEIAFDSGAMDDEPYVPPKDVEIPESFKNIFGGIFR